LKKLENNLGDLYFGDLHMSLNLKSTYKRNLHAGNNTNKSLTIPLKDYEQNPFNWINLCWFFF
jgi:hypothetical protein